MADFLASPAPNRENRLVSTTNTPRQRIGELLISAGVLTEEQLAEALTKPRTEGERIGDVLVRLQFVTETQLTQTLSQQLSVPWVSLYHVEFSRQLLNLVPEDLAELHCLVPVFVRKTKKEGEVLFVAMADPTNEGALLLVKSNCGLPVRPMIASRSDILAAIRVYYTGESPEIPPPPVSQPLVAPPSPPAAAAPPPKAPPPLPPKATKSMVDAGEAPPPPKSEPDTMPEAEPKTLTRPVAKTPSSGIPMVALTLLDGTTIQLPAAKGRRASRPVPAGEVDPLTARDLVTALRAVTHGADAKEILGDQPKWEPVVAALLSVLLRKGLIADWEFVEEFRKI